MYPLTKVHPLLTLSSLTEAVVILRYEKATGICNVGENLLKTGI